MSNREFVHDIVLQVAACVAFFAIMYAITAWNCARCDAALNKSLAPSLSPICGETNDALAAKRAQRGAQVFEGGAR